MNLCGLILRLAGWKTDITAPDFDKCIICVAPHTSNWDFFLGKLAYGSVGRKAGFLMKSDWFFFPLGIILKAIGGIPVVRRKKSDSLVSAIVDKFNTTTKPLHIAITPEGTRSRTAKWRTGFLHISYLAKVPCLLGVIDAATKTVIVRDVFWATDDTEADMRKVKEYYKNYTGVHPEKFTTE